MMRLRLAGCHANVLRVFYQSEAAEIQSGLNWYETMGALACERMRATNRQRKLGHSLPRNKCLGIIAALSPQKSWTRNLSLAESILYRSNIGVVKIQEEKGRKILGGEDPADVLKGPKERAFYECFAEYDTTRSVTIDGHTLNIWLGEYKSTADTKVTPRLFKLCTRDFQAVADSVGLRPHQLQAICWIAWRRMNGSKGHTMDRNAGL